MTKQRLLTRRDYFRLSAAAAAGVSLAPHAAFSGPGVPAPQMRSFGKTGRKVTTLGLGGQASLQWTPDDVDPVEIILKTFALGVNYYDTSNMYGPSQFNYHKAFEKLKLIPGEAGYDRALRESITLTSKTLMRWGKPGWPERDGVRNVSNGEEVQCAVGDLKRSVSQLFGDGRGNYPEGAYLDCMLIHSITSFEEVDVLYQGIETPLDPEGDFGALAALRDYRDGTNLTGTNPKGEKLVRHLGFSGHNNPPAMIDMIQRDEEGLLEVLLVSINANDRRYFNMQNNVIPVAKAKGMGIVGMKVFADAAMYGKEPRFSKTPADVYRKVGSPKLPSRELIEYVLDSPDIHTLIIGIGHVDEDPLKCQLTQNYYAAQVGANTLSAERRREIEEMTGAVTGGRTNYFQLDKQELGAPREVTVEKAAGGTRVSWQTAYAAGAPIVRYEVVVDGAEPAVVRHEPQTLKSKPFVFETEAAVEKVVVRTVDAEGGTAVAAVG